MSQQQPKQLQLIVAMAAALVVAMPAMAQQSSTSPAVMTKELGSNMTAEVVTALVTAVDQKNRIVTLKGPEGNEFAVAVDPSVKNLAQVKAGDMLAVKYFKAVAVSFSKGDGIRMATSIDTSETAKKGPMPGAGAFTRVNTVSNIWAINQAKGTVLVRGPSATSSRSPCGTRSSSRV